MTTTNTQQSHQYLGLIFLMLNRKDGLRIRLDVDRLSPVVVWVLDMLRDLLPCASTIAGEDKSAETTDCVHGGVSSEWMDRWGSKSNGYHVPTFVCVQE